MFTTVWFSMVGFENSHVTQQSLKARQLCWILVHNRNRDFNEVFLMFGTFRFTYFISTNLAALIDVEIYRRTVSDIPITFWKTRKYILHLSTSNYNCFFLYTRRKKPSKTDTGAALIAYLFRCLVSFYIHACTSLKNRLTCVWCSVKI